MAPYAFHPGLRRVSITGADDKVPVAALRALGGQYPFVEWALLYVPNRSHPAEHQCAPCGVLGLRGSRRVPSGPVGPDIILQHQELTAPVIERFLRELGPKDAPRVHVLLDESRGKGLAPASWSIPTQYAGLPVYVGFAGGIGPANTQDVLNQVRALMRPYWIDMETSVRTDNAFDVAKVEAVLRAAEPFVAR